jgi:hypothetical protein
MVLKFDNTNNKSDEVKNVIMAMKNNQAAVHTLNRQRVLIMVGRR